MTPLLHRLGDLWLRLVQSLWFVPFVLILGHAALAALMVGADLHFQGDSDAEDATARFAVPKLLAAGGDGARAVLSTVAGALITAAGVTLSGMLVALSVAASQYSSRILRSLASKRMHQVALGQIVGAFVYSLIVLSTIDSSDGVDRFVPHRAALLAVPMGVVGVSLLIALIHSVSRSIQASEILDSIARETVLSANHLFPADPPPPAQTPVDAGPPLGESVGWVAVPAASSGYLRSVDVEGLVDEACEHELLLCMDAAIGDFVIEGRPVLSVLASRDPEQIDLGELVSGHISVGSFRTVEQDAAYGLRQLVDIALRALSPGVNDPTTAVMAIHRITQVLALVAERPDPVRGHRRGGTLRLVERRHDFETLLALGFDQILETIEGGNAAIEAEVVKACETLERCARRDTVRTAASGVARRVRG